MTAKGDTPLERFVNMMCYDDIQSRDTGRKTIKQILYQLRCEIRKLSQNRVLRRYTELWHKINNRKNLTLIEAGVRPISLEVILSTQIEKTSNDSLKIGVDKETWGFFLRKKKNFILDKYFILFCA